MLQSNEDMPRESSMKWLMEADLIADLSDDEIIEEMMMMVARLMATGSRWLLTTSELAFELIHSQLR